MKKLLLTAFLFCLLITIQAQPIWFGKEGQRFYDELLTRIKMNENFDYEGSPYMNDEFSKSTIILKSGEVLEKVPLRYNVFNDQFEVEIENVAYGLNRGDMINKVIIDNRHFVYSPYILQSKEKEGYLELLHKGDYSLYRQIKVRFEEEQPAQPFIEKRPAMFSKKRPLYYIASGDELPVYIRSKRGAINYGEENGLDLKKYIKKKRLKMNDTEDFMELVKYMNQQ